MKTHHVTMETYHVTMETHHVTMETHHVTMETYRVTMETHHVTMETHRVTMETYRVTMETHHVTMETIKQHPCSSALKEKVKVDHSFSDLYLFGFLQFSCHSQKFVLRERKPSKEGGRNWCCYDNR